jgi:hypothetical protein
MIRTLSSFLLLLVLVTSCQKSNSPDEVLDSSKSTASQNYLPLQVGNWWAYEWDITDPEGNPGTTQIDSLICDADSLIGGQLFHHLHGTHSLFEFQDIWLRDSAGYYVDHHGVKRYSYVDFENTLAANVNENFECYSSMMNCFFEVTVPAGTYQCLLREDSCYMLIQAADSIFYPGIYTAQEIGIVEEHRFFAGSGSELQYRLLDYHLED